MSATLATTRAGRIVLHVVTACRSHRWAWHFAGIRRELTLN
jgi:hypothetical protein